LRREDRQHQRRAAAVSTAHRQPAPLATAVPAAAITSAAPPAPPLAVVRWIGPAEAPPRTVIPATRAATNAVAACPSGCQPRLVAQTRRPATAAATIPVRIRRTQQTAPPPARRMRLAPACSGAALVPPRRI